MAYTWEELVEGCKEYVQEGELINYFSKISDYAGCSKTEVASRVKNIGDLVNDVIYSWGKESIEIKTQKHTSSQIQEEGVAPTLEEQTQQSVGDGNGLREGQLTERPLNGLYAPTLLGSFTKKIREVKLLFLRLLEPITGLSPSPSNITNETGASNNAEAANRPFIEHIRDVSYDMLQNASRLIRRNRGSRARNGIQ